MGVLFERENTSNLLTLYGFEFVCSSVTGVLSNCYEKALVLSDFYTAWIAVQIETGKGFIYIEYDCGGEVASYDFQMEHTSYSYAPYAFFKELDEIVTEYTESYLD